MTQRFLPLRPLAVLAALLCLAGCASPRLIVGHDEIRVMSFNIRLNIESDGEHAWPHRAARTASVIRYHEPHVVGLQEAKIEQLEDLDESLPGYDWVGVGRDDGASGGEFSAIMYRTDRLDLVETETFWLSESPDMPGSKGWDAAFPRVVTWALFERKSDGQRFYHFNTHFDHVGEEARRRSAQMILDAIENREEDLPAIVTGDFNAEPDSDPYAVITGSLKDARLISSTKPHGPEGTFSGFVATQNPMHRIDYVFVSPDVRVERYATLAEHWEGRHASDHVPVVADVVLP